jgi:hypothetical protein
MASQIASPVAAAIWNVSTAALDEELLRGHGKRSHRMNVRENRPPSRWRTSVPHAQIRLDRSGLVVRRERLEAERRVRFFTMGSILQIIL